MAELLSTNGNLISTNQLINVSYGANSSPSSLPTGATEGNVFLVTDTGTSGGTVTEEFIYDGQQWKEITVGGGGSQTIPFSAFTDIQSGYAVRLKEDGKIIKTDYTENGVVGTGVITSNAAIQGIVSSTYVTTTNQTLGLAFSADTPVLLVGTVNPTTREIVYGSPLQLSTITGFGPAQYIHYDPVIDIALVMYGISGNQVRLISIVRSGTSYSVGTSLNIQFVNDIPIIGRITSNRSNRFYVSSSALNTFGVLIKTLTVTAGSITVNTTSPSPSIGGPVSHGLVWYKTDRVALISYYRSSVSVIVYNTAANTFGTNLNVSSVPNLNVNDYFNAFNGTGTQDFIAGWVGDHNTSALKFTLTNDTTPSGVLLTRIVKPNGAWVQGSGVVTSPNTNNLFFTALFNNVVTSQNDVDVVQFGLSGSTSTYWDTLAYLGVFQDTSSNYYALGTNFDTGVEYWDALGIVEFTDLPIIGIAQQSGTTGNIVNVAVENTVSTVQSGLTPSFNYYANPDGSLSLNGDTYMGIALSPTELNLMFSNPAGNSVPSLSVIDNTITDPANITAPGRYIVPASGVTGSFIGQENKYADYDGSSFTYVTPTNGDKVSIATGANAGNVYNYTGGQWVLSAQVTTLPTSNWVSSATYKQGDLVIYQNFTYQANNNIPANTAFNVGTTGATWKPINGGVIAEYFNWYKSDGTNLVLNNIGPTKYNYSTATATRTTNNSGFSFLNDNVVIPNAGVYRVTVSGFVFPAAGYGTNVQTFINLTTAAGAVANIELSLSATLRQEFTLDSIITVTSGGQFWVTFSNSTLTGTLGIFGMSLNVEKIGGFAPVVGSTTGFASAIKTANQTLNDNVTNITFESVSGNIAQSGGAFTLNAGTTYELEAGITTSFVGASLYQWYDITNSAWLGGVQVAISPSSSQTLAFAGGIASAIITPSSNIQVAFRQRNNTTNNTISNNDLTTTNVRAWANITQLGTTNTSVFTGTISPSWNISNTYPLGTVVINGDAMYQANSLIPAGTTFTTGLTGATWKPINGGGVIPEYGENNLSTNVQLSNNNVVTLLTANIPSAGTWEIEYSLNTDNNGAGTDDGASFWVADSNGTEIPNSGQNTALTTQAAGAACTISRSVFVTTNGPATYTVRGQRFTTGNVVVMGGATVSSAQGTPITYRGTSKVSWTKVSGFAPVVGSTSSVAKYTRTTNQTGISANSPIICNVMELLGGTNISVNTTTGSVTLVAGNTYRLRGQVGHCVNAGVATAMSYQWFNVTTNSWVGQPSAVISPQGGTNDGVNMSTAEFVVTPSTNSVFQLRVLNATNTSSIQSDSGTASFTVGAPFIDIEQLGTTNTSAFTGSISPSWSSGNTYSLGTLVVNEGVLYQANGLVPAGTPFITGTVGATWLQIGLLNGQAEYNSIYPTSGSTTLSSTFADLPGSTLTLPSAGVYRVYYNMNTLGNTDGGAAIFAITDSSNVVYNGSNGISIKIYGAANASVASQEITITVNAPTTIKLRWRTNGSGTSTLVNNANPTNSVFGYEKISGFLPATSPGSVPNWNSAGTIQAVGVSGTTAAGGGTAPTLPTNTLRNNISYKQIGPKTWQVIGTINFTDTTGAVAGSGDYVFTLPNGLQFDTTLPQQPIFQGNIQTNNGSTFRNQLATSSFSYSRSDNYSTVNPSGIIIWDATRYRISYNNNGFSYQCWGSGLVPFSEAGGGSWTFTFQTP